MNRQPGYYHVKFKGDNEWYILRWFEVLGWHSLALDGVKHGGTQMTDDMFSEVNENRIPDPGEKIEFKDYTHSLLGTIIMLVGRGIDFKYDAATNNLSYHEPGIVKIVTTTITGGFNFSD